MLAKRRAAAVGFFLLSSVLFSQSLVEIAQKERERRAALNGKKAVVVTNADLAKAKRKPAVEVPARPSASPAVPASEESAPTEPPAPADVKSEAAPALPPSPPPAELMSATLKDLQERWDKAKEYVELLTLKMGALWQEYNGLRDPGAKEAVRQSISETYAKLQTAQEVETKARLEFEKLLGESKKESTPPIWVR